jgi:diaminohydroxyphosphoribosylaminopyrimidine deaminase/5-amino-6-(5-phosphoribosylamino)uracil reductase
MPEINHEFFMKRCLQLARKAEGFTNPNPMVGAVIVKNNKIISEGYHKKAGEEHAEVIAIERAGKTLRDAILYVNLEPCSTYGRTPPCTDRIINSGIKKVVIGMKDPNPVHNGRGINILRKAGVEVITGVMEEEARKLNRVFIKHITQRIPYITIKLALTLDGRIADYKGNSKWISSDRVRFYFHKEIRRKVDAILVGINTILKDNPSLSARRPDGSYYKKQPVKIVLDARFRISEHANLFKTSDRDVIVVIGKNVRKFNKEQKFIARGIKILKAPLKNSRIDLRWLVKKLYRLGICHILVEGGGKVISDFLEHRLCDELYLSYSPLIIGGEKLFYAGKAMELSGGIRLKNSGFKRLDNQIIIKGELNYVYRDNNCERKTQKD